MPVIFSKSVFSPFFDRRISVEGKRPFTPGHSRKVAGTFQACVFDNGPSDPLMDTDAGTNVRTFSISVRAGDWLDHTPPQTGDTITIGEVRTAVSRVETVTGDTWTLTAREVAA